MPAILDRLVHQLKMQGKSESDAFNIAKHALIKAGDLNPDGSVTEKGLKRGMMTPAQRTISRAAEKSGRDPSDYVYDPRTNTAKISRLKR